MIGENEQGVKTVAANPNAIAYVSIGAAAHNIASGSPIEVLPMNGVAASVDNVKAGKFPLSRPLNLVTRGLLADDRCRWPPSAWRSGRSLRRRRPSHEHGGRRLDR